MLDKGEYIASESSYYRVLRATQAASGVVKAIKPTSYTAADSNQVYTWDITYLPFKGSRPALLSVRYRGYLQPKNRGL